MLVWMDLEMTGLDHTADVIVEIATLVTDDELNIVAEGPDLVIHQPDDVLATMHPFVVDMHTRSGLLDQIRASTITLAEAGAETLAFIREHAPVAATVPLCGNSIGTDRRFLAAYLPEIEEYLHYRSVDVSSIKELVRRWYPDALNARGWKQGSHRALDDIRESVTELKLYRDLVFAEPAVVADRVEALKAFLAEAEQATDEPVSGAGGDGEERVVSGAGGDGEERVVSGAGGDGEERAVTGGHPTPVTGDLP